MPKRPVLLYGVFRTFQNKMQFFRSGIHVFNSRSRSVRSRPLVPLESVMEAQHGIARLFNPIQMVHTLLCGSVLASYLQEQSHKLQEITRKLRAATNSYKMHVCVHVQKHVMV